MLRFTAVLMTTLYLLRSRYTDQMQNRARDERGVNTLEMVVIGVALFGIALIAVAAFRDKVAEYLDRLG